MFLMGVCDTDLEKSPMPTAYPLSFSHEAANLEKSRVELVLRVFGLRNWVGQVIEEHYRLQGERRLSFAAFDRVFPGFPICLEASLLYRLVEHTTCSQAAMFRDFRRYVPYQRFLEIEESLTERAKGRPIGLLYRWEGLKPGLILHNGEFPGAGFKQTYTHGPTRVTVEYFGRFVRTLAATNSTVESLRVPPDKNLAQDNRPPILRPWELARLVPDRAEFRLLAFLLEILFDMPPDAARLYIVRRDGERWINITQERLAELLGLCVRNIQRAVAALHRKGLIEKRRNPSFENEMRVCLDRLAGMGGNPCQAK